MGLILGVYNKKANILLVIRTLADVVVFMPKFIYMKITEQVFGEPLHHVNKFLVMCMLILRW